MAAEVSGVGEGFPEVVKQVHFYFKLNNLIQTSCLKARFCPVSLCL